MASGELLLLLALHLILTGLPGVAAALFAARRGLASVPVLLAIALAASGAVAMLSFWSYFGDRVLGETFSYFAVLGSALAIGWSLYGGQIDRALLRSLATPLALWVLGSAFLLLLGFVHGGTETPLVTASTRFSHPLPGDNYLPLYFAEWFFENGHHGTAPDYASFLASDRPPLQIGYALSQRPFPWNANGLDYQVLGVVLQQLWIVGLWALLLAAGVGRVTRALTTVAVLLSSLAILNGFFVWPKLLPAAMLLAAAALVMTPLWTKLRSSLWAAALVGALCALAMLGHGSSVFGIFPIAAVAAYRGLPSWRWLGVGLLVGAALMAPWSAFQKYEDPPGNRLAKWTLAGVVEIDERGTMEAIVDSYREAGVSGVLHYKGQNIATISGGTMAPIALRDAVETGDLGLVARAVRTVSFFYLLPSLGLLLLAPFAMAAARSRGRRNPAEWTFALACFAAFALGTFIWGLLVFGSSNDRTLLHISSYLLPILGIVGCVVGLRATFPRFALYYVGAISLLSLAVYAPSLDPPAGSAYSVLSAVIAAAALAGFVATAVRSDRQAGAAQPRGAAGAGRPSPRPEQEGSDSGQAPLQVRVAKRVDGGDLPPAVD